MMVPHRFNYWLNPHVGRRNGNVTDDQAALLMAHEPVEVVEVRIWGQTVGAVSAIRGALVFNTHRHGRGRGLS